MGINIMPLLSIPTDEDILLYFKEDSVNMKYFKLLKC